MEIKLTDREDVREIVRQKYGEAATAVLTGAGSASCCTSGCECDPITSNLYEGVASEIPETAVLASLGCGNPTALASLKEGETVLDLGSGGGIDVLLSAKRVGPTGFAYGLDMTDEMLQLAEQNKQKAGAENVKFLKGHIEDIPLPDDSVDVIISNCVINLSGDKPTVIKEAFRVLKPGGRFAVSDVVVEGELPPALRQDIEAYVGCVAGALEVNEYLGLLREAGFTDASVEVTRRYHFDDIADSTVTPTTIANLSEEERRRYDGKVMAGFIRATKPFA